MHDKGNNLHEMRIEANDSVIKPFKKVIHRTVGFQQYCPRPPINKIELNSILQFVNILLELYIVTI